MMILDTCPGVKDLKTPTLTIKKCPKCGEEVEIFSNDTQVSCETCGFVIYNDTLSCIQWCNYAKECVGEEKRCIMHFIKKREADN